MAKKLQGERIPMTSSQHSNDQRRLRDAERGFSMIEMMIVVVIVAVLAAVAFVAYKNHLRKGYVVEAQEFVTKIVAQQELIRQRTGAYMDLGTNDIFPLMAASEPMQKSWSATPTAWNNLGLRPEKGASYFGFVVRASLAGSHALTNHASNARVGIPPQPTVADPADPNYIAPHPWFYVIAIGDMDGDGGASCNTPNPSAVTQCTMIIASSANPSPKVFNQNE